jgi:hypothetical protein
LSTSPAATAAPTVVIHGMMLSILWSRIGLWCRWVMPASAATS